MAEGSKLSDPAQILADLRSLESRMNAPILKRAADLIEYVMLASREAPIAYLHEHERWPPELEFSPLLPGDEALGWTQTELYRRSIPSPKSAPAVTAPHNSGERDPSVMPDYTGADAADEFAKKFAAKFRAKVCLGGRDD